ATRVGRTLPAQRQQHLELPVLEPVSAQGVPPDLRDVPVQDSQPDEDRLLNRVKPAEFFRPDGDVLIDPVVHLTQRSSARRSRSSFLVDSFSHYYRARYDEHGEPDDTRHRPAG